MKIKRAFTVAGVLFCLAPYASYAVQIEKQQNSIKKIDAQIHKSGEVLIKLKSGAKLTSVASTLSSKGIASVKSLKVPKAMSKKAIARWNVAKIAQGMDEKKVIEQLRKDPNIESVEFNYQRKALTTPNDPRFDELWAMNNTGQKGGVEDADIDAIEAWDTISEAPDVIVAVIDTGVDYAHEDLAANMWTNPGEIPDNGIDDDNNGYIDDVYGYDFFNYDNDPMDQFGHGTHVSGTIAGVGNNDIGVTGVSWNSKIMAVQFLGPDGYGWDDAAAQAILYAVTNGAKITNNSWGGGWYSEILYDAISAANDADVMFVAAAGNWNSDNDIWDNFPSNYDLPNVVAVAATDNFDDYTWFTNYGKKTVDLAAPGQDILSTVPSGGVWLSDPSGYMYLSGTSMATPHVAGAAALLLGQDPTRTVSAIKNLLMDTTDSISDNYGWGRDTASGGRLNLANAVNCDSSILNLRVKSLADGFVYEQGKTISVLASATACGSQVPDATLTASFSNGQTDLELFDDGIHDDGIANNGLFGNAWLADVVGDVNITITANSQSLGNSSKTVTGFIREKVFYTVEEAPYAWVDTTYANRVWLGDDDATYIWLDFPFEFYGNQYQYLMLSSNGLLSFVDYAIQYENQAMPNPTLPNGLIAPFWDDLKPSDGNIFFQYDGVAPNRSMTFSWVKAGHFDSPTGAVTFQVTLNEGSKDIVFQYKDVMFENPLFDAATSATIGVENEDGSSATQYSHNTAVLRNEMALRFTPHYINQPPVANAGGAYEANRVTPLVFDGSQSFDPEGASLTYAWDFGDGTSASGVNPSHQYTTLGKYDVSLIVSDGVKQSEVAFTTVSVINLNPAANAGPDQSVRKNAKTVTLNGSKSADADGSIVSYQWKQLSGTTAIINAANSAVASFAMPKNIAAPSTMVFELTVADNNGGVSTDQVVINITK